MCSLSSICIATLNQPEHRGRSYFVNATTSEQPRITVRRPSWTTNFGPWHANVSERITQHASVLPRAVLHCIVPSSGALQYQRVSKCEICVQIQSSRLLEGLQYHTSSVHGSRTRSEEVCTVAGRNNNRELMPFRSPSLWYVHLDDCIHRVCISPMEWSRFITDREEYPVQHAGRRLLGQTFGRFSFTVLSFQHESHAPNYHEDICSLATEGFFRGHTSSSSRSLLRNIS